MKKKNIMAISRRKILGILATIPLLGGLARASETNSKIHSVPSYLSGNFTSDNSDASEIKSELRSLIIPKALRRGSTVAITAPASPVSYNEMRDGISTLNALGCKVVLGNSVQHRTKLPYLSAPDEDRAKEFMSFIENPEIDAIICARGGYGVMRILPMLDYEKIRQNPKIIVGYSDITALAIAIHRHSGLVTFHGPVASSTFDPFTKEYFTKTLFAPEKILEKNFPEIEFADSRISVIAEGLASGPLTGGNLSMIVSTLGTPYEINTKGAILFLEEIAEEPYKLDRMLTQLWLAGKLENCAGVALGAFTNCEGGRRSPSDMTMTMREVLTNRLSKLGIPVMFGLPIGHVVSKLTLPIGIYAELNTMKKSITLVEAPVQA